MKTIYIDRNFVSRYGFNKRLDDCLQHQELNPSDLIGLEFEPNFYETITNCLKYYKVFIVAGHVKDKCDIFISDDINAMDNNAIDIANIVILFLSLSLFSHRYDKK